MNAVRDLWSDDRLDDLNHRVDEGFNRNEREFQALRLEMRTEFAAVRLEVKEEIGSVRGELSALNRTLTRIAAGGLITVLVAFLGFVATQL